MEERFAQTGSKETITRRAFFFVALWAAVILLLFAAGGYFGVRQLKRYKEETERFRQTWMESATDEAGAPTTELTLPPGAKPAEVRVGVYINRMGEFSLRESGWTADFDIWFRWTGDGVKPGEDFEIVNGQVDSREKMEEYSNGRERYERYRVKARLTKYFDPSRFPFSDEMLAILVEDGVHGVKTMRYVADERDSGISSLGVPRNLKITYLLAAVMLHDYRSGRGDPRLSAGERDIHSWFVFSMIVDPPSLGIYILMYQALFASIAIALIVFFIKPIHVDPRFGLGVGAFFAAVANNVVVASTLPQSKQITLAGMVNAAGLATIMLTLVQSAVSLYILDTMGLNKLRRLFDRVSFVVFLTGYAVVNLLLPMAART